MGKTGILKIPFSKTRLAGIEAPERGREYHYDTGQPGLALCVTCAGTKTFYFVKKLDGKALRVRLGRFPDLTVFQARTMAKRHALDVAAGVDPQAAKRERREEATLGGLWAHWLETHAKLRKKTWGEDKRQWESYLKTWASRRLSSIKPADVRNLHNHLGQKHGKPTANRVLALLRAMFGRAGDLGFSGANPARGIPKFPEKARDRFLRADELPRFFRALEAEPNPILRGFFLIALLTGARRRNVEAMRYEHVDWTTATWRIPETKSGEPLEVPLCPAALEVLIAIRPLSKDGWVFPGRQAKCGHLTEPMPAWRRICKAARLEDLRIHDLRRSLGSWQALQGASLQVIGKSLGHSRPETTAIYSRLTLDPVRESVNQATTAMLTAGGRLKLEGPADAED